jgi:anaerobic magnesium-protoporphyrin IX monomethyl ester cyclase
MTICLITPPSCFLLDERVFLSLGILKVAAVLERHDHIVEMLDLSGIEGFEEAIGDHASRSQAKVFGITATTPQMPAVAKIVSVLRKVRPDARLILGGPHITLVCAALKREKKIGVSGRATRAYAELEGMFDTLVAGDGEDAIFVALNPNCDKLIDADKPSGPLFLTNEKLNELPWPARHLVDVDSYHYTIEGHRALSLIAQLGCPFACGFCGGRESPMLRRIRTRTTENIVKEVLHLHEAYGSTGIMFYDDELNVNQSMVELMDALAAAQKELGVELRLRGFIKSQLFTDEQADAMYRAGFRWILVGFESGSERILENINKKANRSENTRCMQIAKRHGLKVKALMSMGHPGESEETIKDTKDWLLEVKPDDFDATVITTYPGTPYFDWAVQTAPTTWTYTYPKNGDRLHAHDVEFTQEAGYYKGKPGEYQSFVWTDYLTPEQLVKLRDGLEAEVRQRLNIPFNQSAAALKYEHSMGQGLPGYILKQTACA